MHISAAGIPMIFLNDYKTYNDLLQNRGDIYSDKPRMVMTGELCGAEYMVRLFLNYQIKTPSFSGVRAPALTVFLRRSRSRVREIE